LYQADKKINYYESTVMGEQNPYNPFKFEAEFTVNVLEEGKFEHLKEGVQKTFGV